MPFACARILTSSLCTTTFSVHDHAGRGLSAASTRIGERYSCLVRGTIAQISISPGGVPKLPVPSGDVRTLGIAGDDHRNKKYHGGPRQAILLIASEVIDGLAGQGWPLFYGALGENLTTRGLNHALWRAGQRFRVGQVVLELTKPRAPCQTLNVYGKGIQSVIFDDRVKALDPASAFWGMSGFYASVVRCGFISTNDIIELLDQVV